MVRQWQQIFNDRRYSYVDLEVSPDFLKKLADAFNLKRPSIQLKHSIKILNPILHLMKASSWIVALNVRIMYCQ